MMENTNINWVAMTDDAIIAQMGIFIKKTRIAKNKTQAQIATAAGLNRWTISQIENGESVTLSVLIQILRALEALYVLDQFSISDQISPLQAVKLKKKERKRVKNASTTKTKKKSNW